MIKYSSMNTCFTDNLDYFRVTNKTKVEVLNGTENDGKVATEEQEKGEAQLTTSIALDYPELCSDYSDFSNQHSQSQRRPRDPTASQKNGPSLDGLSPLNSSQIISRRLKLDLRNESEIPIAGMIT